jgi:hypothetical protein
LPVFFQNAVVNCDVENGVGCSPFNFDKSVAWRALNFFLNRLARRISVGLMNHWPCRIWQVAPDRSKAFLNLRSANAIGSLSAITIRTPMLVRLVRLTRCRWNRVHLKKSGSITSPPARVIRACMIFSLTVLFTKRAEPSAMPIQKPSAEGRPNLGKALFG